MAVEVIGAELVTIKHTLVKKVKLKRRHVYESKQKLIDVEKRFVAIYGIKNTHQLWLSYKNYGRNKNPYRTSAKKVVSI